MQLKYFEEVARLTGVLGLKVSQNGALLAHKTWDEECRRNVYSVSKSFTACAVGFAIQEGLLSLEEPLCAAFPECLPGQVSEQLAAATVRDTLTMCLGQAEPHLMGASRPLYQEDDWVRLALSFPFAHRPGTHFMYSNVGPYLAGMLVQRRAGQNLVDYLMPRLFAPLGISRPTWETDPLGNTFGAGGLNLTLSELHRFGLFLLAGGAWQGRQLLPASWLQTCANAQTQAQAPYGYLFWRGEHNSFRADGKYCQLVIVFPERQAVVTVVSECRTPAVLMRAIYDDLYAQLQ